ncbi:MAG: VWA domain-containing protein [Deltaproteobacteria bacterium]|nr:VWA domain-containing protein [Deltaproteobacteria bacterium]
MMRMFGIDFAQPWFLLAALLAPVAVWFSLRSAGRVVFSSLRALPHGGETWRTRFAWLPDALIGLAVVALAIALAGPRAGDKSSRVRRDGIAIMMAVDVSGSMRALDLSAKNRELTRLDAVKEVFEKFVLGGKGLDGRPDDAIGLVAFARYADTRSPLTLDHGNLASAARQLEFATEGEDGTHIGAGLELAVTRLAEFKPKDKTVGRIVILLTDGESNFHEIDEDTAIEDAVKAGVKVYTIGAGTNGIAPIRTQRGDLMQVQVSIDETTLRKIADKTGGQYFRATDNASLAKIYGQIAELETTTIEQDQFTEYRQHYAMFVVIAMLLVVVAFVLRGTVLRRLP